MHKEEIIKMMRGLSATQKSELVIRLSKAGISLEKDFIPMLGKLVDLFEESLLAENIRFMGKIQGGNKDESTY